MLSASIGVFLVGIFESKRLAPDLQLCSFVNIAELVATALNIRTIFGQIVSDF